MELPGSDPDNDGIDRRERFPMNETAGPAANGPSTLMARLREETMSLHRETEQGSLQQDLLAGRFPLSAYADLLQQLLVLHRAIERALVRQSTHSGPIGAVVREYQFQESHLLRDLRRRHLRRPQHLLVPRGGLLHLAGQ